MVPSTVDRPSGAGRTGAGLFIATWTAIVIVMAFPRLVPSFDGTVGNVTVLFWLVLVAASLCTVTSLGLTVVAHRNDLPELGFVSIWFLCLSILPLVHGLTTPGVLYGETAAFGTAVLLAGPLAALSIAPLLVRGRLGAFAGRHWLEWFWGWLVALTVLAGVMLIWPNAISGPAPTSPLTMLVALPTVAVAARYSWRHLQFARISGQSRYLVIFFGFAFSGVANLVWLSPMPFGSTFWFAHAFDITGVFLGTIGGVVVYVHHRRTSDLLAPILLADPLVALDLGLDPSVDAYMRVLDAKDRVTRDHALRTAEAAIQLATSLRLSASDVRDTGIAAVLHDIGKLGIPDAVLNKPGALDDAEFRVMQRHTEIGFDLLRLNPGLRHVAPLVRAHHERFDGCGYPDRLAGTDIPLPARIVAVCDAYDAMAHDRPYRQGIGPDRAAAILREHAGSQWDGRVVEPMLALVANGRIRTAPTVLDHLGHAGAASTSLPDSVVCGCLAALPGDVAAELIGA